MMAAQRSYTSLPPPFPELKPNKKIALKKDLIKWCERNGLGWSHDEIDQQGKIFVSRVADVMWELDGHRGTLLNRGYAVPAMFDDFVNYNQPAKAKHRKREHGNLEKQKVVELSQMLFELAGKVFMKRQAWKPVREALLRLADNLRNYASYLEKQVDATRAVDSRKSLRTDIDDWQV